MKPQRPDVPDKIRRSIFGREPSRHYVLLIMRKLPPCLVENILIFHRRKRLACPRRTAAVRAGVSSINRGNTINPQVPSSSARCVVPVCIST
ncbi:hypothetical protein J3458_002962 [Metarhizium acridum]|uniref:uncharacterized protein n=1 Tax=Metarhizium acridum TaxID=92637 RepID=UPI001C6AB1F0|nr:hypothetical protein J3458_002962 [Metarhizium acridum]